MITVIKNARIIQTKTPVNVIEKADIVIEGRLIKEVGLNCADKYRADKVIDATGKTVIPGFVCAHHHYYSGLSRGMLIGAGPQTDLIQILKEWWWRLDRALDEESLYYSSLMVFMSTCTMYLDEKPTVNKVDNMLYEVTFNEYSNEIPDSSAYEQMTGDMACSSVRNGGFVGRNFDYFMNQCPTFVIRTTAKKGRYATIGVGRLAKIDSEMVENGLSREKLELLPWFLLDGMNEKGLVVNSNVLYKADWGEIPHSGTNPNAPELNAIFLIRPLLDNCATVDQAVKYLRNYNITPMNSTKMDLHYMISDPKKTCVVEFYNNEIVVKEQNIMTNYFINIDKIPEHPDGLERMQVLSTHYEEGNTMEGMYNLMKRVKYTNLYDASNKWYSELGLTYEQLQNISGEADEYLQTMQMEFIDELKYIKENGYREKTDWWDTTHNSIYDINNGRLWITVHEHYEEKPHKFLLKMTI